MPSCFDHAFVFTAAAAEVAARMTRAGLCEGPANTHPGQGTANRRFFFQGGMIELLYVADVEALTRPELARTGLWPRSLFRERDSCPIGLCASEPPDAPESLAPAWDYRPPYLPPGAAIRMADDAHDERRPLLFAVPPRTGGADVPRDPRSISRIELTLPSLPSSYRYAAWLERLGVAVTLGAPSLLTVELDRARTGAALDLRPAASLLLRW